MGTEKPGKSHKQGKTGIYGESGKQPFSGTNGVWPVSADMFGVEDATAQRTNDRPEAAALVEVLKALRHHPAIAWAERQNTGAAQVGGRFVRFGWRGCSDVIGMLKDGRLLAVEVKAPSGKLRAEQAEFLSLVRRFGGVAFMARSCRDVLDELNRHG